MEPILDRLKRERRWAIAIFLVSAAVVFGVQAAFAPERTPAAGDAARPEPVESMP